MSPSARDVLPTGAWSERWPGSEGGETRGGTPHAGIRRLCVDKASLSLDGISPTIAELHDDSATFCIIPPTREQANLQTTEAGQGMNLKADMLTRHVATLMEGRS
ncbi:hypothetical protein [Haloferula sp. A504]|uniref:hypothetical protein n=1 Tax=Haloferula sp. A504 TaxID=3373601 RepID=UPI0031BC1FFB|nr:hypothetical protein [Verrucomicrobiaceae bacterium E54]